MRANDTRAAGRRQSRSAITPQVRTIGSAARLSRAALVVAPPVHSGFIGAMPKRLLMFAAAGAALAITAGPAAATDNPPPGVKPGACVDHVKPTSGFTAKAARRAARKRLLRGTAGDTGCGLNSVSIAVARKKGSKCRPLKRNKRLARLMRCSKHRWLPVRGTTHWSFRLPKRLPRGRYVIQTRAIDFAGNVHRSHTRRLRLR